MHIETWRKFLKNKPKDDEVLKIKLGEADDPF